MFVLKKKHTCTQDELGGFSYVMYFYSALICVAKKCVCTKCADVVLQTGLQAVGHETRQLLELDFLRNVLRLDVLVLVADEDQLALVLPAVFLRPGAQSQICGKK